MTEKFDAARREREPMGMEPDYNAYRCGHNYPTDRCPHPHCGYREALARVADLEAEVERLKEEIRVKDDDFHRERKALLSLLDEANAEIARLNAELVVLQKRFGIDPNRCPIMLPNAYGEEQCGRDRGHEGHCCYVRGD